MDISSYEENTDLIRIDCNQTYTEFNISIIFYMWE